MRCRFLFPKSAATASLPLGEVTPHSDSFEGVLNWRHATDPPFPSFASHKESLKVCAGEEEEEEGVTHTHTHRRALKKDASLASAFYCGGGGALFFLTYVEKKEGLFTCGNAAAYDGQQTHICVAIAHRHI